VRGKRVWEGDQSRGEVRSTSLPNERMLARRIGHHTTCGQTFEGARRTKPERNCDDDVKANVRAEQKNGGEREGNRFFACLKGLRATKKFAGREHWEKSEIR